MIQKSIYKQDITRKIDGVIKASSDENIITEIKEFVITAEQKQPRLLPDVFKMLAPNEKPDCVWISGDFGSGKSHLLKILSYVLENQLTVEGQKCADFFADKVTDDFELKGAIQIACRVPTESILFNIQEQLDGVGKNNLDPVLSIFLKVFNQKLGYDGKNPEIAEIERYLDDKGKYDYMKEQYEQRFGETWEKARKSIRLKLQKLAEIMADIEETSKEIAYQNLLTQINNYRLDTEGFAELVKEHLDRHPGHRMIFFVDEVGQFIGKSDQRMISLQTIAEDLVPKTGGRATMMVTSQMDIDATLGNLEKKQEYDFSRIQGRFTTHVNLTSANADEVIQRRLLDKEPEPQKQLCSVYEKQKNIIKTLFNFGDNSQFCTKYKDGDHFAIDFPFIDYQFDLLQRAIIELSKNNAFSGKQQSVGERSLLTIAQDVAVLYSTKDMDQIVQFADMYEGIRGILQTKVQTDIQQAEKTLGDETALKVLKALFLVKYVKGFPSTADNITKLMLPTLDTDFIELRSQIQTALNKLVHLSYIEKGANDEYHYQTNEEKDIETEIKNEELQPDAINGELKKMFRDEIFTENRIKLSPNKIFRYGLVVDEQQDGRDAEIYIHFITPLNSHLGASQENRLMYSMQRPGQLCVFLGEDQYLLDDLTMFKKAARCLDRLLSENDSYRQQIVTDKRRVNQRRRDDIVNRLTVLTKTARLYIDGHELTDIRSSDLRQRLNEGMAHLVEKVYTNLKMLTVEYDDAMLKTIIADTSNGKLFGTTIEVAGLEVLNFINQNKRMSVRTKVKDLVDHFRSGNYGWYDNATLCILAVLYKQDKISFRSNGSPVTERDLYYNLTNATQQAMLIVDVEEEITNSQIKRLKDIYKEFFEDEACQAQTAKDVHNRFTERLNQEIKKLTDIQTQHNYSFIRPLDELMPQLQTISTYIFPALYSKTKELDDLVDVKVDVADQIRQFVGSAQFDIFKRIDQCERGNKANLAYVSQNLRETLHHIYQSETPWKEMTTAVQILDQIGREITEKQETARQEVIKLITEKQASLEALPGYTVLDAAKQGQVTAMMTILSEEAANERFIGNMIALKAQVETAYNRSLDSVNKWVEEMSSQQEPAKDNGCSDDGSQPTPTKKKVVKMVVNRQKAMNVSFSKPMLETREDVEEYVDALRRQLLEFIDQNKNIMLN